jgi:hypothetical protein
MEQLHDVTDEIEEFRYLSCSFVERATEAEVGRRGAARRRKQR